MRMRLLLLLAIGVLLLAGCSSNAREPQTDQEPKSIAQIKVYSPPT